MKTWDASGSRLAADLKMILAETTRRMDADKARNRVSSPGEEPNRAGHGKSSKRFEADKAWNKIYRRH